MAGFNLTPQTQKGIMAGGAMSGIGSGLYNLFGASDPSQAANKYLNQIPGTMEKYYNPYINAGMQSLPQLQSQYQNLLNDPSSVMKMLGSGYQQSPGYQFQLNQALGGANNAAAAGGMAGSPAAQYQSANIAQGLASQDYNNYLSNAMNLYGTGLQGMQGLNNQGFQASTGLADALSSNLMNQANLGYAGAMNQNQTQGQGLGSLFGGLGSLAGLFGF